MSRIDTTVTNEAVIPVIEAQIFNASPEHQFAIGMLATGYELVDDRGGIFTGYLRLRANVYASQTNMIPGNEVRPDGTEKDADDSRSTHWAILERAREQEQELGFQGLARVVASIRTIEKTATDQRPLPIEVFFPEAFTAPLPLGAVEVSRYICRHENPIIQSRLSAPLFSAVVGHIQSKGFSPTFGVVEEKVEQRLERYGVPMQRIALPKFVPEYAADNLGFSVDIQAMAEFMGLDNPEALAKIRSEQRKWSYFNIEAPSL